MSGVENHEVCQKCGKWHEWNTNGREWWQASKAAEYCCGGGFYPTEPTGDN
mgnify:FL=1|tara:strand:- start:414 stop:566 length:153 start_codon:yes stop_codon:yes gene_type:complete